MGYSNSQSDQYETLVEILGDYFINSLGQKVPSHALTHVEKYIGIYFSASWAAPCQEFNKMLIDFYKKVNLRNKRIEVVYVNSDEDMYSFNAYIKSMPWLSIPFGDERVMELK